MDEEDSLAGGLSFFLVIYLAIIDSNEAVGRNRGRHYGCLSDVDTKLLCFLADNMQLFVCYISCSLS